VRRYGARRAGTPRAPRDAAAQDPDVEFANALEDRPTTELPAALDDVADGAGEDGATTPVTARPVRKIEPVAEPTVDLTAAHPPTRPTASGSGCCSASPARQCCWWRPRWWWPSARTTARSAGPLANKAFVDSAATAELVGQVTNAMTTVYSYDYNTLPANEAAAKGVITGKFATEFPRVFEPVKQLAPQEQAVLKSTVPAAGVILLQGDRARLLMMVDQIGTRGTAKEPTGATARLVVDAQKVDGRWKIAEVTPE